MATYEGQLPKEILSLFETDVGTGEFFTYVGNLVSVEQALAVLGILSPDFVEYKGHVFWQPNAVKNPISDNYLKGFRRTTSGELEPSIRRMDIERYRNNFSVSQFFSKWENSAERPIFQVGLSEADYKLCSCFAIQLERYWKIALSDCFPGRSIKFEVADNILDEYGVCITFWQVE